MSLAGWIAALEQLLADSGQRLEHLRRFQEAVWGEEVADADPDVDDLLGELAYDLDFYEPDPRARAEDPSFFGDERLEREVRAALDRLRAM